MSLELMQAFDFTAEDLSYNRMGQLSPRQMEMYKKADTKSSVFAFFVMIGFGVGAYFVLSPFWAQGLSLGENVGRLIGGIILAGIALFFLYALFEKTEPKIRSAKGKIKFVVKETDSTDADGTTSTSTTHYVVVGDEYFSVDRKKYQHLEQGHIYIFYQESSVLGRVIAVEYIGPPQE